MTLTGRNGFAALASFLLTIGCGSTADTAPSDASTVESLSLTSLGDSTLPAKLSDALSVTAGSLVLHNNGTFSETLTRNTAEGVGGTSGAHGQIVADLAIGLWTQISPDRMEFQYTDRRPAVFDTAAVTSGGIAVHCVAYSWCDGQLLLAFRK